MVKPLITTNVRWDTDQMSGRILNTFRGSHLILTMPCEASNEKPRVGGYKNRSWGSEANADSFTPRPVVITYPGFLSTLLLFLFIYLGTSKMCA